MTAAGGESITSAVLVVVGDELLAGAHPDDNSPLLARRLADVGVAVERVTVVADEEEAIARATDEGLARAPLVVLTGGLGPTLDDVTRHAVARALGRELRLSEPALARLEGFFAERGVPMPEPNRRQALFPAGAEMLANRAGTASGFRVEEGSRVVAALPGPPAEMRVVLQEELLPWLVASGRVGPPVAQRKLFLFGLSESVFAAEVGDWMGRGADPRIACSAKHGTLAVVLRAVGRDRERSRALLDERTEELRRRFRDHLFSEEDGRIELVFGAELLAAGLTVTTAESCTGGLVATLLTRTPGISRLFAEGFVTYSNEVKERALGVPAEVLRRHGAVSAEVARAMALGAAERTGARLALSVTGVAGPGGGTAEKPVGLVWFGVALDGGVETFRRRFPDVGRERVREFAAHAALHLGLGRLRSRAAD